MKVMKGGKGSKHFCVVITREGKFPNNLWNSDRGTVKSNLIYFTV